MSSELDPDTHNRISKLAAEGDAFAERKDFNSALRKYADAWALIPQPKDQWEASTWVLGAIGDALFKKGDFADAFEAFTAALDAPGAIGNPFIHLRIGQTALELGDRARAVDELARAYMGGGRKMFVEDDPKYFELLKQHLKPPPGQTEL